MGGPRAQAGGPRAQASIEAARSVNASLTFDTGALIGLERRRPHLSRLHQTALLEGVPVVVPSVVLAEWWRRGKREKERAEILRTLVVEPLTSHVARLAGTAIGIVGASIADAIVMASASLRGGLVYTSDPDELERLIEVFGDVRVVAV